MALSQASFEAIGTKWTIRAEHSTSQSAWNKLLSRLHTRIDTFDATHSRFRSDSLVAHMSQHAGTYKLPPDGFALLRYYHELYRATDGAVTPLIGQTISDAGYDAMYSLTPRRNGLRTPPAWEDILTYKPGQITLHDPTLLDFGAAGKGYLVDILGNMLTQAGVASFVINAGGDILQRSTAGRALEVGLEHPADATQAIGVARITNQSLCASAGSKRTWNTYHHIINPKTLASPRDIIATWVIADTTMLADGLATALFFTDPTHLAKTFAFEAAVLHADMNLTHTKHFPVQLFQATV